MQLSRTDRPAPCFCWRGPSLLRRVSGFAVRSGGLSLSAALGLLALCSAYAAPAPTPAPSSTGKTFAPVEDLHAPLEKLRNQFVVVPGKDPNGWSFTLEPYVWAIGMSGRVGVKGLPAVNVDYSSKTILQHLDWGIFARGEVRKGRWGILGDGFFAQLSTDGNPPGPLYQNASLKIQQGMVSLALAYRLIDDRRGFLDIYAGARYNYAGFNFGAATDSAGIQTVSQQAAGTVTTQVGQRVDSFLARNAAALVPAVQSAVLQQVKGIVGDSVGQFPGDLRDSLDRRDLIRIVNQVTSRSGEYRELVAAVAAARVAAAKNQLTSAVQDRVTQAQKKFAKALAQKIEDSLPTSAEGSQWWVDPIIGLRAQVNFTRWLFLAAQGDVGGFGAGSDIAWNVQATLGVNFTRNIFGELGYRYFYMDYQNNGALYQAGESGIFTGIGVKF